MRTLMQHPLFDVLLDEERQIAVFRRTTQASTVETVVPAFEELQRAVTTWPHAGWALLMDLRKAPMRNEPHFERAIGEFIPKLLAGFARVAVLVSTAVGKLQVTRVAREQGRTSYVFDDEAAATAWLMER